MIGASERGERMDPLAAGEAQGSLGPNCERPCLPPHARLATQDLWRAPPARTRKRRIRPAKGF